MSYKLLLASIFISGSLANPAAAQTPADYAFNFLKEVGCSQLPFQACDVLDRDNAVNILRAYQALLVNKNCGTGNIEAAKQLLEIDSALDPDRCRAVLRGIGAIR